MNNRVMIFKDIYEYSQHGVSPTQCCYPTSALPPILLFLGRLLAHAVIVAHDSQ